MLQNGQPKSFFGIDVNSIPSRSRFQQSKESNSTNITTRVRAPPRSPDAWELAGAGTISAEFGSGVITGHGMVEFLGDSSPSIASLEHVSRAESW